jgi:alpha-galactosidase
MDDEQPIIDNGRRRIVVQSLWSIACLAGLTPAAMMRKNLKREAENVIKAQRVAHAPAASDLDHAAWNKAQAIHIARYWSGEEAPVKRHAEARLLWSDEALCVRFVCCQSEPLNLSTTPRKDQKTIGLWDRDVCEIFIAPDANRPEHYFEFEAAPTGEWLDLAIRWKPVERETEWDFHSGMTAAAIIGGISVWIAMRIPWKALGHTPKVGERWRGNLFRCVGAGETRGYLAWRPTRTERPDFHIPKAFGEIIFKG